jgi:hypothetical protein
MWALVALGLGLLQGMQWGKVVVAPSLRCDWPCVLTRRVPVGADPAFIAVVVVFVVVCVCGGGGGSGAGRVGLCWSGGFNIVFELMGHR